MILSAVSPTCWLVASRMMATARDTGSAGSLCGSFLDLGGLAALVTTPPQKPNDDQADKQDGNDAKRVCIRNVMICSGSPRENSRDQGGISHVETLDPTRETLQSGPPVKRHQCPAPGTGAV